MNAPIVRWFESAEFTEKVIQLGIGELVRRGATNIGGMTKYCMDGRYKDDAQLIAGLVKDHNNKVKLNAGL